MTRLVLLLLLCLPLAAHAADAKTIPQESRKLVNAELRFGGLFLADDNLQASYGGGGEFFTVVEVGLVPWSKYVHLEIDFNFGFSQFRGSQSFVDGGSSADQTMMTFFPLGVDLT